MIIFIQLILILIKSTEEHKFYIFSHENPHPIDLDSNQMNRGAVFADSARFDRCAQLWLHALNLRCVVGLFFAFSILLFDAVGVPKNGISIKSHFFQARQSAASD